MTKNLSASIHIGRSICWIGFSVLLLAGFGRSQSASDWPQFHNTNMQRWNPYETALNGNNVGNLQVKWSFPTVSPQEFSSPSVANGVVYIGSGDGYVYALNAGTGALLWRSWVGPAAYSSPAVANGVIYIGSMNHKVYALKATTGAKLWSYTTGGEVFYSVAVASGVVYAGSGDGNLYALNASTGALLWSYPAGGTTSPAVADGLVYAGSGDGNLYALNASTGAPLWSYPAGGNTTLPAVANGVVYVGSGDGNGNVYALSAKTGILLWSYPLGGWIVSSPAVADGIVYVTSENGYIIALNASTGAALWSYTDQMLDAEASPAVANGIVYYCVNGGNAYALNARTGALLWTYGAYASGASPTVVNGVLYLGAEFQVLAFALPTVNLNLRVIPYPIPPVQGGLLSYAFKVWNQSSVDAWHEVLMTQVPAGTTFSGLTISGTAGVGSCTHPAVGTTGSVICHEGSGMAPGTTWTIRLTVQVTAPTGTVITETATASSDNVGSSTVKVSNTVH